MPTKTITIQPSGLGIGTDLDTFSLYHTSAIPANLITSSITRADLVAGFSYDVDPSYFTFVVQDETYGGQQTLNLPAPTITSFTPTSGESGSIIDIVGSGFAGATAVSFGGTAATSFSVLNNTFLSASVGAGSTGEVAVTNPKGSDNAPGFSFQTTATDTTYLLGRFGYDKSSPTGLCSSPNSYPNYYLYAENYNSLLSAQAATATVYTDSSLTLEAPYGWYVLRLDSTGQPTTDDVDSAYEISGQGIPITRIECGDPVGAGE